LVVNSIIIWQEFEKLSLEATSYIFADYFKLADEVDSIVGYFGYQFSKDYLPLPCSSKELTRLDDLKLRLKENYRYDYCYCCDDSGYDNNSDEKCHDDDHDGVCDSDDDD